MVSQSETMMLRKFTEKTVRFRWASLTSRWNLKEKSRNNANLETTREPQSCWMSTTLLTQSITGWNWEVCWSNNSDYVLSLFRHQDANIIVTKTNIIITSINDCSDSRPCKTKRSIWLVRRSPFAATVHRLVYRGSAPNRISVDNKRWISRTSRRDETRLRCTVESWRICALSVHLT